MAGIEKLPLQKEIDVYVHSIATDEMIFEAFGEKIEKGRALNYFERIKEWRGSRIDEVKCLKCSSERVAEIFGECELEQIECSMCKGKIEFGICSIAALSIDGFAVYSEGGVLIRNEKRRIEEPPLLPLALYGIKEYEC